MFTQIERAVWRNVSSWDSEFWVDEDGTECKYPGPSCFWPEDYEYARYGWTPHDDGELAHEIFDLVWTRLSDIAEQNASAAPNNAGEGDEEDDEDDDDDEEGEDMEPGDEKEDTGKAIEDNGDVGSDDKEEANNEDIDAGEVQKDASDVVDYSGDESDNEEPEAEEAEEDSGNDGQGANDDSMDAIGDEAYLRKLWTDASDRMSYAWPRDLPDMPPRVLMMIEGELMLYTYRQYADRVAKANGRA